ncbi:MAG: bifunctional folylpolyglutamate synthase/dihydrofolate synthase [Elusimicrobiota bacterium]|jgi:dihydrofolate synthase/folylpolyglutamate synthase|nr:bifunctional folylpolyglutamate synthase/dihydrofolate synthase [Elusimicrobiota bacterium]
MKYLDSLKEYQGMKPGLSRIRNFLKHIGNPERSFKSIQIAGTNGKGSTALFLSNILRRHGYRTGLYTSPHLINVCERIKIDAKEISQKTFNAILKKYNSCAKKFGLSYFEYLTAIAFIYFADKKIDTAVLETGLGGRFDATNIVKNPLSCIITSISFDHEEILGSSLSKIAYEKAGIIKKNAFVICPPLVKPAMKEIEKKAKPYVFSKSFRVKNVNAAKGIQEFDYYGINNNFKNLKISMSGAHQIQNCAIAVCAAELILGLKINKQSLVAALLESVHTARFDIKKIQLENKKIELIIDGAHNIEGIYSFIKTWKSEGYAQKKRPLIFALMKQKDYRKIAKALYPFASKIILPKLDNPRSLETKKIKEVFLKLDSQIEIIETDNIKKVFRQIKNNEKVAAVGSLYLAGEVLNFINQLGDYYD